MRRRLYSSATSRSRLAAVAALSRGPLKLVCVRRSEGWLPLHRLRYTSVTSHFRRANVAAPPRWPLRLASVPRSEGWPPPCRRSTRQSRLACAVPPLQHQAVEAQWRAAIRGLASTASPALHVSHVSPEVCSTRSAVSWVVKARVRAAIGGPASTASSTLHISHVSLGACMNRTIT